MPAHEHSILSRFVGGPYSEDAVAELAKAAREEVGGGFTAIFAFLSSSWKADLADLCEVLQIHAHCPRIFGCSADAFISGAEEIEDTEGCSLLFLRLADTEIGLLEDLEPGDSHLFLGNPFGDPLAFLEECRGTHPKGAIYGGLASGGRTPEEIFLFTETGVVDEGHLLVTLRGRVGIKGAVSHGCRPIGEPLVITGVEGNVIETVGGQKICDVLEETYGALSEEEQEASSGNILVGIAMSEYQEEHRSGDFFISSILGGDPQTGSISIAAEPNVGQTLQFQLRDRESAHRDMETVCRGIGAKAGGEEILGGLLFTCTGRGSQLFGDPGHDSGIIAEHLGGRPMAGFFCNGEVGPVGGQNFLHAFTASMAFFVER